MYKRQVCFSLLALLQKQDSLPAACPSEGLLYFVYTEWAFLAIFVFMKIPFFFQNGSTSLPLHVGVAIANITAEPSWPLYTKTTCLCDS